jgi:crotonobetainyl-CoA:carnitine CoA-transferase CaiB-like acyl-CoA transferase
MSSGIADAGMKELGKNRPVPLPVQALDHAVGYLMAAAAIRGLTNRLKSGAGCQARTSLARMAAMLISQPVARTREAIAPETQNDHSGNVEETAWGPARRIKPPVVVDGAPLQWDLPASKLGSAEAKWLGRK